MKNYYSKNFLVKLFVFVTLFFGIQVQSQTTIDFSLGYADNFQFGKSTNIAGFTFSINSTDPSDDITYDDGSQSNSGSSALYDDNLDIGGITKWTIKKTDLTEFKLISIFLKDAGYGSKTGTIKAFKDGAQVGTTVAVSFNGVLTFSANTDFQNIDEIQIEAADINFFLDNFIYTTAVTPCIAPTIPIITYIPTAICSGSTTTLNIAGTLNDATAWKIYTGSCGGTLVGSTSTSSFIVTPSSPSTTYFVRGEGGCVVPGSCGSVVVNVTPIPATPTISAGGLTTFCAGGSVTLTSSSATGNLWSTAETTQSITVSTAGTYTVAVTSGGCTSATSAGTIVTVNPKPAVDAGANQSICSGATATLTATCNSMNVSAALGGASEVPANGSTATGIVTGSFDKITKQLTLKILFNGLTGGIASAGHIHKGAVGVSGAVVIPFTTVPAATSGSFTYSGTLTDNQVTDLLAGLYYVNIHNATFGGGEIRGQLSTNCLADSFVWNNGGGNGQTIMVSPTTTTIYTVTASNSITGCSSTSQTTVTVNPIVNLGLTVNSGILTATQTGATYKWFQCPNTLITGAVNQSYSPTTIGDYKAEITLNGCTVTSNCVTVTTLDVDDFNYFSKFVVYPNPTTGVLNIRSGVETNFTVLNQMGQLVKEFHVNVGNNSVNLEELVDGVYFVKGSKQNKTYKLIIKK